MFVETWTLVCTSTFILCVVTHSYMGAGLMESLPSNKYHLFCYVVLYDVVSSYIYKHTVLCTRCVANEYSVL